MDREPRFGDVYRYDDGEILMFVHDKCQVILVSVDYGVEPNDFVSEDVRYPEWGLVEHAPG